MRFDAHGEARAASAGGLGITPPSACAAHAAFGAPLLGIALRRSHNNLQSLSFHLRLSNSCTSCAMRH